MKKLLSIILVFSLVLSLFTGIISVNAASALTGREGFLFGTAVTEMNAANSTLAQVEKEILHAKALGSNIIRMSEPNDHDYEFLAEVITIAEKYGMKIMLVLDHVYYDFMYDSETGLPYDDVSKINSDAITEHYSKIVGTFSGKIAYYQLGNELDKYYYISGDQGRIYDVDGGKYRDVATAVAALDAVKDAVAIDDTAKTVVNFNWLHYGLLEGLKNADFTWDVTGLDWYSSGSYNEEYGANGSVAQYDYGYCLEQIKDYAPEIMVCETGLTPYQTEDGSVAYYGDAAWIEKFCTDVYANEKVIGIINYHLFDPTPSEEYNKEDYYGLIDADGSYKESYTTYSNLFGGDENVLYIADGNNDAFWAIDTKIYGDSIFKANSTSIYGKTTGNFVKMDKSNITSWIYDDYSGYSLDGKTYLSPYGYSSNWYVDFKVAANTVLQFDIAMWEAHWTALDTLDEEFKFSVDTGEGFNEAGLKYLSYTTNSNNTVRTYNFRAEDYCTFRITFPDMNVVRDYADDNNTGGQNSSILYRGACLLSAPYGSGAFEPDVITELSAGSTDVFSTDETTKIYGSAYKVNADTLYGSIVGSLAQMEKGDISGWIYDDYGSDYSLDGKTYIAPYGSGARHFEFRVDAGTLVEFDIAMWQWMWEYFSKNNMDYTFSVDKGNGFVDLGADEISYASNANNTVRVYNYFAEDYCVFKITYPNMNDMFTYAKDNKPSGQDSSIFYRGACLLSAPKGIYILSAGTKDNLSKVEPYMNTPIIGQDVYTVTGSDYAKTPNTSTIYDIVANPVNNNSNWTWGGINKFETLSIDGTYVYSPVGHSKVSSSTVKPYVDFTVAGATEITVPIGMYGEMWNLGEFTFEFAPIGSATFAMISADDYYYTSETQQMNYNYNGTDVTTGYYNLTVRTYRVAVPKEGTLRITFPASFKDMISTVKKYYNNSDTFISRSGAAFIVPPSADSISYGDINSDGEENLLDLVALKKMVGGIGGNYDKLAANVDGVSGLNGGDLTVMRKYLLGIEQKLGY